ncbi:MAG: biopolymer transporter ExbD [Gammaproteobacteria bacterium]|nr:biopolymer transporter ExbD [Gammaproteobacteria bacterium]
MKLQAKRAEEVELNLSSLVDVVLLLVIFFMLSTTFVQDSRLRIMLPEAGSASVERSASPVVISISAQGSYRVNDRALVNNGRATLAAALRQVAGDSRRMPVTIRADARSSHQSVVTAMDTAARLGFTQVDIATVSQSAEE